MTASQQHDPAEPARAAMPTYGTARPEILDESAFRTIVDSVAQLMWVNDAGGDVRFFNRFALAYMGRTNAELEGRRWLACLHPDDRERLAAARHAAIAAGEPYTVEGRFRRHDGAYRWQRFEVQPVRAPDGTIVGWIGSARDVHDDRTREERLRAALDASRTGTFRWDIPTGALEWDENLDRLFGLEAGRTARSLDQFIATVHPDDRARVVAACERCARDGADFDEEFRVVWPDGTVRWLHDKGRAYHGADGRSAWMTGACVDVTDRRQQQHDLRALAETMPHLVWMADATGHVYYFNARWEEYTGLAAADLAAGGWPGTVHPDDAPAMEARWTRSIATGEPYEIVYRLGRADGAWRWFVGRAAASRDAQGRVLHWFGSCTDIHDEVLVRERLKRLNAVADALAGARDVAAIARVVAGEGIAALDAMAGRLSVVREDGWTLDIHGAESGPADVAEAWRTFPLDAPVPMATAARTGEALYVTSLEELVARFPIGRDAMVRLGLGALAVLPLAWGGQRLGAISFHFRTAREFDADTRTFLETLARQCAQALDRARLFAGALRAREDAEAARAEAQAANSAKSAFLAMMSHDLRTPINATLGYVDLMAMGIRGPLTAEQAHDLERVRRSQRALLALVSEVLEFTRVEAGRVECRREPLAVADVLGEVVAIMEPLAREQGVALAADAVPAREPPLQAVGDVDRVRQVLLNLLGNAVKFTDAGGAVRLRVDVDDAFVRLRVADTGRGIPADRLASVFEPFVQLSRRDATRIDRGVGLGLAISRELARRMGGDLTAESEEGRGSTFTLALPRG